ncbi:hypothetical protein [Paenibacillus sp. L3-i20]|uniref:hypothetical protein n=1 Tax=Paenibacillus sp. L3-i20 TaxID=2905833 RepID=UPI001EDCC6E7|nr:hypothetical protein [Paenibacillus sp. L3-i20]GKU79268.1 hypothetical protein L3i20_v236650 [Paenibacillus sp. L3-i20]
MNEALMYAAEFIGLENAKAAARYTTAAGIEILNYDPLQDVFHLTDGETYSRPLFISWFCTPIY